MSVFETTLPLIRSVKTPEGALQTQQFLEVCRQILPVVGESQSPRIQASFWPCNHRCPPPRSLFQTPTITTLLFLISPSPSSLPISTAKLGTGFVIVKSDVGGNIDRLATRAATQPQRYDPDIFQIVRDEVAEGAQGGSSSCTKGLLWLKR